MARMGDRAMAYLQIGDNTIHYRDTGQGNTTIVLVSGGTLGLDTWNGFQDRLAKYARVISYDRSGIGNSDYIPNHKSTESMTDELHQVLHMLASDDPIILVGHSIGGYIARKYTELHPKKIAALFLIDAYHESFYRDLRDAISDEMWNDYVSNWENLKGGVSPGMTDEIDYTLQLMESKERFPIPSVIPTYLFTSIKEVEIEDRFVEFNKAALRTHLRLNTQLEKEHPNLRHFITDKSSHYIYLEEPELITDELVAFSER